MYTEANGTDKERIKGNEFTRKINYKLNKMKFITGLDCCCMCVCF